MTVKRLITELKKFKPNTRVYFIPNTPYSDIDEKRRCDVEYIKEANEGIYIFESPVCWMSEQDRNIITKDRDGNEVKIEIPPTPPPFIMDDYDYGCNYNVEITRLLLGCFLFVISLLIICCFHTFT